MSRYRIVLLGHEEKSIQRSLDAIPEDHRINSVIVVGGVNVLAIVENTIPENLRWKDEWTTQLEEQGVLSKQQITSLGPSKPRPAKTKIA